MSTFSNGQYFKLNLKSVVFIEKLSKLGYGLLDSQFNFDNWIQKAENVQLIAYQRTEFSDDCRNDENYLDFGGFCIKVDCLKCFEFVSLDGIFGVFAECLSASFEYNSILKRGIRTKVYNSLCVDFSDADFADEIAS